MILLRVKGQAKAFLKGKAYRPDGLSYGGAGSVSTENSSASLFRATLGGGGVDVLFHRGV